LRHSSATCFMIRGTRKSHSAGPMTTCSRLAVEEFSPTRSAGCNQVSCDGSTAYRNSMRYISFRMLGLRPKSKSRGAWTIFLPLFCILLVVATGTIQAVHCHPVGDISHADCALCATAHVSAQVVEPPVTLYVTPVESFVEAFVAPSRTKTFFTFALFTRPPPVDFVLA
jgi:hypothetical protein